MKRIRKYPDRPNPLFEKWLEDWRKEAMKRDLPIQHLFGKALQSLKKYPLPLSSGKECYILQHFGNKLCTMIDKKLAQHNKLENISSSSNKNSLSSDDNSMTKKQQETSKNSSRESVQQNKTSDKSYVPKIGSASYAILITLYRNTKLPNYPGFMYKKDIISQAQDESKCSLEKKNRERYTGWSCMSLLIKRNLIVKKSNPAKYSLTDAGISLAKSLLEAKERDSLDSSDEDKQNENNLKNIQNSQSACTSATSELNRSESPKKVLDDLEHLNEYPDVIYEIEDDLPYSRKTSSPFKNSSKNTEEADIITIDDDDDDDDDDDMNEPLLMERVDDEEINEIEKVARKEFNVENNDSNDDSFHKFCKENAESLLTEVQQEYNIKRKQTDKKEKVIENVIKEKVAEKVTKEKVAEKVTKEKLAKNIPKAKQNKVTILTESTETFYLLPNNFDIILIVDTQEASGSKYKPEEDPKLSELCKIGIVFEIRSLKIGDFTWIARCRFTNRELVLPYIVERKRMDDLGSSIKDGRYHEQKFRLRQCGINNVIYMVESCGNYHGSIPMNSLLQAAMNSLVQDEFTVKFTDDHKSSMRYLATMTTMLTEIFETKELKSCKKEDLPKTKTDISAGEHSLMEFEEFNKAAVKTKNFTVEEMLLRQLVQLKGMSVEKALAIVQLYPTPKVLAEALEKGDENLLANIVVESTNRKLGPSISKTLHKFYTTLNFN